jgi:hypothetical protein
VLRWVGHITSEYDPLVPKTRLLLPLESIGSERNQMQCFIKKASMQLSHRAFLLKCLPTLLKV